MADGWQGSWDHGEHSWNPPDRPGAFHDIGDAQKKELVDAG